MYVSSPWAYYALANATSSKHYGIAAGISMAILVGFLVVSILAYALIRALCVKIRALRARHNPYATLYNVRVGRDRTSGELRLHVPRPGGASPCSSGGAAEINTDAKKLNSNTRDDELGSKQSEQTYTPVHPPPGVAPGVITYELDPSTNSK